MFYDVILLNASLETEYRCKTTDFLWHSKLYTPGEFQIQIVADDDLDLSVCKYVTVNTKKEIGIIHKANYSSTDPGTVVLSGYFLEHLLYESVLYPTYNASNKTIWQVGAEVCSTYLNDLGFPLVLPSQPSSGVIVPESLSVTKEQTGDYVGTLLYDLAAVFGYGVSITKTDTSLQIDITNYHNRSESKNLFDLSELTQKNDWAVPALYKSYQLKPNTQYTLSSNVPQTATANLYFNGSLTATNGVWAGKPITVTSDSSGFVYVAIPNNPLRAYTTDILNSVYWVQLEEGAAATTYEAFADEEKVFSVGLNSIKKYDVVKDGSNYRNVSVVAGEGEGSARVFEIVDIAETGEQKRHLWVDARDLQQEEGESITDYRLKLRQRGLEKLAETVEIENVEIEIEDEEAQQIGIEYDIGDIVWVIINPIKASYKMKIIEVEDVVNQGKRSTSLIFGDKIPTPWEKVKRFYR